MKIRGVQISLLIISSLSIWTIFIWRLFPCQRPQILSSSARTAPSYLNLMNPAEFSEESDFNCMKVILNHMQFPMCLYEAKEDIYVSKAYIQGGYFEANWVLRFVNMLEVHEDFTFLDIGANLGTYSLPVARLGRHVVAVEPNWNTLRRLSKSVFLGGVATNVDVLYHAIGKERSTSMLKFDRTNRGVTVLMNNVTCKKNCENLNISVSVVTLNDLIPIMRNKKVVIKVDTEGTEINIFTSSSASEFFRMVDVYLIQTEWVFYLKLYTMSSEKRSLVDNFLDFFYQRNYAVYDINSGHRLGLDWTKWPRDVCFKKADAAGKLYSV